MRLLYLFFFFYKTFDIIDLDEFSEGAVYVGCWERFEYRRRLWVKR